MKDLIASFRFKAVRQNDTQS